MMIQTFLLAFILLFSLNASAEKAFPHLSAVGKDTQSCADSLIDKVLKTQDSNITYLYKMKLQAVYAQANGRHGSTFVPNDTDDNAHMCSNTKNQEVEFLLSGYIVYKNRNVVRVDGDLGIVYNSIRDHITGKVIKTTCEVSTWDLGDGTKYAVHVFNRTKYPEGHFFGNVYYPNNGYIINQPLAEK